MTTRCYKKLHELETEIQQLKQERYNKVIVAFRSELSSEIKDPAIGSTIVFDNVPLNLSDAYNPANGVFVAKVAGVYVFHLTASSPPATGNHLAIIIEKNGVKVNYVFLDSNVDFWHHRSLPIVLDLYAGDQVKVTVGNRKESSTIGGSFFHTHFSGVLIARK